jgi:hypothetical protein
MDLKALERELSDLQARYAEWVRPIQEARREKGFRINRGGYKLPDYQREMAEIEQQQLARYDPDEAISGLLDQLCSYYLTAPSEARASIRALVQRQNEDFMETTLFAYIRRGTLRLQTTGDPALLLNGLAAASIENARLDFRDSNRTLADLFVTAERAGIDPTPHFVAVAELSSGDIPTGGPSSMKDTLINFNEYAVVEERRREQ